MEIVEPKVYLVARTETTMGLIHFMEDIGLTPEEVDRYNKTSNGTALVEAMGRMCYRSWAPWDPKRPLCTNPNVGKIREDTSEYIANIIKSGHGSVLEHANYSFVCRDVSRVFTHELVRHRAGMAYSQESLRYVRLNDLRIWIPSIIDQMKMDRSYMDGVIKEYVEMFERIQSRLGDYAAIDEIKDFHTKKQLTSFFRRFAPIGLATTIGFTANARALRHVIQMRTSEAAEEEIQIVFGKIAKIMQEIEPDLFKDPIVRV